MTVKEKLAELRERYPDFPVSDEVWRHSIAVFYGVDDDGEVPA